MVLTDVAVRRAKPRDKDYKLADGGGLYLLVTPAGGRLWRLKYRMHGIERKLSLGRYPDVTLSDARKARDAAREAKEAGTDPAAAKRRERIAAKASAATTFGGVSLEFIAKAEREGRAFSVPPGWLCTDNAAMIAWAGAERYALGLVDGLDAPARARWPLDAAADKVRGAGVKA